MKLLRLVKILWIRSIVLPITLCAVITGFSTLAHAATINSEALPLAGIDFQSDETDESDSPEEDAEEDDEPDCD